MFLVLAAAMMLQNGDGLSMESQGSVRHPSSVNAAAIDAGSALAAVGLDDGTILLYSLADRTPIPLGFRYYTSVTDLAFHPRDRILAVATGDGLLAIHDLSAFKEVKSGRVDSMIRRLAFAPDGSALFAAQNNGRLVKIRVPALEIEGSILPTEGSLVGDVACSPDGKGVVTSDRGGFLSAWSTADLSRTGKWKAHGGYIQALAWDPSGAFLASGGEDHAVRVWSADGTALKGNDTLHSEGIRTLCFAPDGRLVSGGQDGLCQFWKPRTFEADVSRPNYRGFIAASAASPDGKWLVRGGSFLDFVPLDRPGAAERVREYGGAIVGLAGKGKRFVSASLDRTLILWSLEDGVSARTVALTDWATAVGFAPDGKSVAAGLGNGRVEVYSWESAARQAGWLAHDGGVTSVAFVDGRVASAGWDSKVCVWDPAGGLAVKFEESAPVRCLAGDPQGPRLAAGTSSGEVRIYDVQGKALVRALRRRPQSVTSLAFMPDGRTLAAGHFDGTLVAWDTESWEGVREAAGEGASLLSLDGHPKVSLLAAGYRDGRLKLVDPVSLETAASVESRDRREIFGVRFLRDEATVAAAGADHAVSLYRFKGDLEAWLPKARERAAAAAEPKSAAACVKRGNRKSAAGDAEGALRDYTRAIEMDAGSVEARYARAQARHSREEAAGAIEDCTKAVELDPRHVGAYRLRGRVHMENGDLDEAVADFTLAIEHGWTEAENYRCRADAYAAKDLKRHALEDYIKVLRGGDADARAGAVEQIGALGLQDAADVIVPLVKAPESSVRAQAAVALGRLESARDVKLIAGMLRDESAEVRGMALLSLGILRAREYRREVVPFLRGPDKVLRGHAAWALGRLKAVEHTAEILALLKDEDPALKADAALALGEMGVKGVAQALAGLLKSEDANLRGCSAWALGQLEAKECLKDLAGLLDEEDEASVYIQEGRGWVPTSVNDIVQEEPRSEERRVEKERTAKRRSRWSPYQ